MFPLNHSQHQQTIAALHISIDRMILALWPGDFVLHPGINGASSGIFTTALHRGPLVSGILVVKDHLGDARNPSRHRFQQGFSLII